LLQTYKETFLEIRELVFGEHSIDIENYAQELAERSKLDLDEIKNIYNNMSLLKICLKNPKYISNNKRVWEKCEDELMFTYLELSSNELGENGKKRNRKAVFEEISEILIDRTTQSIAFRYYDLHSNKNKNKNKNKNNDTKSETKEMPSEAEIISENISESRVSESSENKNDDLLDVVVDLVNNIDKAGIEINSLFKGLLTLSKRAVDNSNVEKIEHLEGQVSFLEEELNKEKEKNEQLQLEVSRLVSEFEKLKREIEYFDGLDGKQKLQQLNNFNRNLKYIVDKFGGVIVVGLDKAM
jgi:hypothetical protein